MSGIGLKPYDCKEKANIVAFRALPSALQLLIKQTQSKIQQAVQINNPGRKIVATSGFRSFAVNSKVGGVANSLHLWGFARDFRLFADEQEPFIVPDSMICLKSKNCWHVAYKRG
jgi:hypothetical protein